MLLPFIPFRSAPFKASIRMAFALEVHFATYFEALAALGGMLVVETEKGQREHSAQASKNRRDRWWRRNREK